MSAHVPSRVTVVFAGLVLATCITWALGSTARLTGAGFDVAATLTIVIAGAKIFFIGTDFMELRAAPVVLRAVFVMWILGFACTAIGLVVF
ncbi:cytochrome C oxidase subunit IV family protein [Mycolicibacterium sp. 050158]|uniref:cytochrome C oxidase subunit IV family protein n=1 Tax=Mycolicibacterium sp. 050158 TaxID=3090602 RepID=UPI00299DBA63|nr:cytochrome C oxidase subunit IV family protein [Mycolicibacterium sp. 050158]MDX1888928.1 cytochrome C oxidase subunit IV family protein [Mycolicibacterium sp. 050158]